MTIRLQRVRALHYDCNCNYMGGPVRAGGGGRPATQQRSRGRHDGCPLVHAFLSGSYIMRLLNIVSSPRGARSASIAVANAFVDAYRETGATIDVDTLNVWEEDLPDFGSDAIGAKYKGVANAPMDEAEQSIWRRIQSLVKRFQEADRIVVGVPMWNFGYPYKLKQLIDLVSQRNMLFTFDGNAYAPLLEIPRALVIHVRGQSQDAGAGADNPGFRHQADYIEFWLRFIGVSEVRSLTVEHTWGARASDSLERAQARAVAMAAAF
ncbi:NAD(P)H-dependent oxidoreductase [Burkholderia sp. AU45251]|nr:NAD(P)H-dependent oxidoreductase [Burkholderia sp. AU45251]MDN7514662.1 NAD(P)H-dependent oxidoreductase [Burkholderia sp. AU45251]